MQKNLFNYSIVTFLGYLLLTCKPDHHPVDGLISPCFDTLYPVIYDCRAAANGDYAFRTGPATSRRVALLPNMETRLKMNLKTWNGISGIHQFLLDHDLASGFVHAYTRAMFDHLKPEDFVVKFSRDTETYLTGSIEFIQKKDMNPEDALGKNIAFFRQWRLSEIDYYEKAENVMVRMDTCRYYTHCVCPSAKAGSKRPLQIPLWHRGKSGYQPLKDFSAFGRVDGGTAVIVWEYNNRIWFQDIHSSLLEILSTAIAISKKYKTDPAICISDAGPFARKIKADKNSSIRVSDINSLAPQGKKFGAGYGYVIQKTPVH